MAQRRIRTGESPRVRFRCPEGSHEVPQFGFNEDGDLVVTGKTDLFKYIQSFEDESNLAKLIERSRLTGVDFSAPAEAFGDDRLLPKSLLDIQNKANQINEFTSSLSDEDLAVLKDKGFDKFLEEKLLALQQAQNLTEVKADE